MTESRLLGDLPVGLALSLGAYRAAEHITFAEPRGETRDRMSNALGFLETGLLTTGPEVFVSGKLPGLRDVAKDWGPDDKWRFLVELRCSNPFYPYQFEMSSARARSRDASLGDICRNALGLPLASGDEVGEAWKLILSSERSHLRKQAIREKALRPKTWLVALGAGAALAGAAVVAAPAIAIMMPAAGGLSGAAAVSAGLAQLGFGSVAAGGLGMVGGMWVLGATGAAAGAISATTTQLLAEPGRAYLVGVEVRKLLVTFALATQGKLSTPPEEFASGLDVMTDEVDQLIEIEAVRNEAGCDRLAELRELQRTLQFAGEFMAFSLRGEAEPAG